VLNRLLCLDIETVPDEVLLPADWDPETFPAKPVWHRVVAISFVEADIVIHRGVERFNDEERDVGFERYQVSCCRSGGEAGYSEEKLLEAFWQRFAAQPARVVSWNGRAFDLPVLRTRSMVYGISAAPWYRLGDKWNSFTQRFAPDWHCDLMEVLADFGASARMGLDDMALAMGLPGKLGGHGSEVAGMVARGEIERVRAYCEGDVLNLFALYVRWARLVGKTDAEGHDASLESLVACLVKKREAKPHFGEFLHRWHASTRPRPMFLDPRRGHGPDR
jgi:predicted PolB exonuclease-like 3'-5' exonuclease